MGGKGLFAVGMAVALGAAAAVSWSPRDRLDGVSLDLLFWMRERLGSISRPISPVVVIAIDEATYQSPGLGGLPVAMWTPQVAIAVDAAVDAGAAVIGFDIVLPTSVEPLLPGHDRTFLRGLRRAAQAGKLVLGEVQHQERPVRPAAGQLVAAGGRANLRLLNLLTDPDEVIRRAPLAFTRFNGDGTTTDEPSFALELAARAVGVVAEIGPGGQRLGDYQIPIAGDRAIMLNFAAGADDFPTYSMADVVACAEAGDRDYLREAFAGRVVLVGAVLDVEDRKVTSKRLVTAREGMNRPASCRLPPARPSLHVRDSIPGVYVQATAVRNLIERRVLAEPSHAQRAGMTGAVAATAALVAAFTAPLVAAAAVMALAVMTAVAATLAFAGGTVLPLLDIIVAAGAATMIVAGLRAAASEAERRRVRGMFGLYLAPELVTRMLASSSPPQLGGERRDMTVIFTDIAGFTNFSEHTDPAVLTEIMNAYFEGVAAAVTAEGGLVNEFIGDAVLAYFGAPFDAPDHPVRGLACARAIDAFAEDFRCAQQSRGIVFGATRIGVHSGVATLGNIGASHRMKYSALGDVVNTAARIESLNKHFGTRLSASAVTVERAGDPDARPLGDIVLKGRSTALRIFQILPVGAAADPWEVRYRAAYQALAAGEGGARDILHALAAERPDAAGSLSHLLALTRPTVELVMAEK